MFNIEKVTSTIVANSTAISDPVWTETQDDAASKTQFLTQLTSLLKEIRSNEKTDFTKALIKYINNTDDNSGSVQLIASIDHLLVEAYDEKCSLSERIVQDALFMIYQIHLAHPLSKPSRRQYDPTVALLKTKIEQTWLHHEFRGVEVEESLQTTDKFIELLMSLWKSHSVLGHSLFDFLENEASEEQIFFFFKNESSLNSIFLDLLDRAVMGAEPEMRKILIKNLADDTQHGNDALNYSRLNKEIINQKGIIIPQDYYVDLYDIPALNRHNTFMVGSVNRCHYYKLLGVICMTKILNPAQCAKFAKGCNRLGLAKPDLNYFPQSSDTHRKLEEEKLQNLIKIVAMLSPGSKKEFYLGSLLRLNTADRYYSHLLSRMKQLTKAQI